MRNNYFTLRYPYCRYMTAMMIGTIMTEEESGEATRSARRVLVIHNPAAGRGRRRKMAEVVAHLETLGCPVTMQETTGRGDAEDIASRISSEEVDVVVTAGGDGTINEVVNGLLAGPGGVALGIIPLGTANVLALEIGLDLQDTLRIARTIAFGPVLRVRPGIANRRHFMAMAGAGLDAQVVAGVSPAMKRRTGKLAYVLESLRQAFGYDYPRLTIRTESAEYEASMVVACRTRLYGGPFVAAPNARLDGPCLELCLLPRRGLTGMLRYGLALPLGLLPGLPEVMLVSASNAIIVGPRDAPVQADGDIVARLPLEIGVSDEEVDLIVPEAA